MEPEVAGSRPVSHPTISLLWGSDEAVEDDVGKGLEEAGTVPLVAVAEEGEERLLAGRLRGRHDGEDDGVQGDIAELP